jgi:hypothetical protein
MEEARDVWLRNLDKLEHRCFITRMTWTHRTVGVGYLCTLPGARACCAVGKLAGKVLGQCASHENIARESRMLHNDYYTRRDE